MEITKDIKYVGVNDYKIDLFEGQFKVENGMAYNSYVMLDEKVAVFDTVDINFRDEWLFNVKEALGGRKPDYLVVHHMEPDHSANIINFLEIYKDVKIVATAKAFDMMNQFFDTDFKERAIIVKDKDTLCLGKHTLTFVTAPMVHWPEVMMTYDDLSKSFFSADAFGKFGALNYDEEWACEARRYYFGIVGKYGMQVQALFKKIAGLDIERICPLHGPVLSENLSYYLGLYDTWSSYKPETKGIVINYTSVYGNTKKAVYMLVDELRNLGIDKVAVNDLARCDMYEAVEDAFRYDKMVLATTTYNMGIFPFMREFLEHLVERGYKNRFIALIENGSWAPMAKKGMEKILEGLKGIEYAENSVSVLSALNDKSREEIKALAKELAEKSK